MEPQIPPPTPSATSGAIQARRALAGEVNLPKVIKSIVETTRPLGLVDKDRMELMVDAGADIKSRYKASTLTRRYLECWSFMTCPSRQNTLAVVCACPELSQFEIRNEEKRFFAHLKEHQGLGHGTDGKDNKALMLVQKQLLGRPMPNLLKAASHKDIAKDLHKICDILTHLLKYLSELCAVVHNGRGFNTALTVYRSVNARVWDGTDRELLQLDNVGATRMEKFAQAGITKLAQLRTKEAYEIERILHVNPPFGQNIIQQLSGIPQLRCDVLVCKIPLEGLHSIPTDQLRDPTSSTYRNAIRRYRSGKEEHTWCIKINLRYLNEYTNPDQTPIWKGKSPCVTFSLSGSDGVLHDRWTGSTKDIQHGRKFWVKVRGPAGYKVEAIFACDNIVGAKDTVEWQI